MAAKKKKKRTTKASTPTIIKPSQSDRMPRFLIYARTKKGKTTFGSTAPKVLIVDPEDGTDELKVRDPDVTKVRSWEDVDSVYRYLKTTDHGYEWVVWDGLGQIHKFAVDFVTRKRQEVDLRKRPKGYTSLKDRGRANDLLEELMLGVHSLPMGVVWTAHERTVTIGEEEDDDDSGLTLVTVDLSQGARGSALMLVDVVGRLYTVKVKKKKRSRVQRRLWIGPHDRFDTGYRSDHDLPDMLKNPTVPRLMQLIRTGNPKKKG